MRRRRSESQGPTPEEELKRGGWPCTATHPSQKSRNSKIAAGDWKGLLRGGSGRRDCLCLALGRAAGLRLARLGAGQLGLALNGVATGRGLGRDLDLLDRRLAALHRDLLGKGVGGELFLPDLNRVGPVLEALGRD